LLGGAANPHGASELVFGLKDLLANVTRQILVLAKEPIDGQ